VGQEAIVGPGTLLREAIRDDKLPCIILWGPPGSGKTTLAHVVSHATRHEFVPFSAVLGGVPELRVIIAEAAERRAYQGRGTILFVDEIHRFNKSQQDAFLPHLEKGTVILIGATTENPSFSVNAALLSRSKVLRLEPLDDEALVKVIERALVDAEHGLGGRGMTADDNAVRAMAAEARGDARRALNLLEAAVELAGGGPGQIDVALVERAAGEHVLLYDKAGEEHYNVTSALIKSLRGSDPDAAIYWMMRMIDSGDDPLFIMRRLVIFASEDIGNADPRALQVAVAADQAFRRLGMPEGIYPMAHACLYLASCPKSNAVKRAWQAARAVVDERGALPVPKKLRNPVTPLMRDEGYGKGYRYAHDFEGHHVPGETYLPEELEGSRFYEPSEEGLEKSIAERLARMRSRT